MRNRQKMKVSHPLRLMIVLMLGLFVMGCDIDKVEIETAQDIAFEILGAGPWSLGDGAGSILVDGTNVSANYPGFSLTIGDGTYSTINSDDLFSASGTWQWIDDEATMIRLDDGKELSIVTLNQFRFTFTFSLADGGVRAGIPGNYTVSVVQ